jgi:hypothetical protein
VALRVFAACLVLAVAVGAALWLHGYREYGPITTATVSAGGTVSYTSQGPFVSAVSSSTHPPWADPLAAGIVVAALGLGAAIVVSRFGRPPEAAR